MLIIDDKEFRQLYDKHFKTIFRFVLWRVSNHHDAENLTQETFIRIRKRKIETDPLAYLKKVAGRVIYKYWEKKRKDKLISIENDFGNDDAIADLIHNPIDQSTLPTEKKRQELQAYLIELVQTLSKKEILSEEEKTIIELRYLTEQPLKYKEIQEILDITSPTCKKYHNLAMEKLLKEIKLYLDG